MMSRPIGSNRRSTPGASSLDSRDEAGREQDRLNVGRRDADDAPERRGVEGRGLEQAAQVFQRRRDFGSEALRQRARRKRAAGADEQRIAERLPEPRQRAAHRRLAQPDLRRRLGDVAEPEQRLEGRQEIEVDSR